MKDDEKTFWNAILEDLTGCVVKNRRFGGFDIHLREKIETPHFSGIGLRHEFTVFFRDDILILRSSSESASAYCFNVNEVDWVDSFEETWRNLPE